MSEQVVVDVAFLRKALLLLMDHLVESEGSTVSLDHDMFWSLDAPDVFNPYSEPKTLTMGQLSASLESLRGMVERDQPLTFGLVWVADLLRAIGLEVVR